MSWPVSLQRGFLEVLFHVRPIAAQLFEAVLRTLIGSTIFNYSYYLIFNPLNALAPTISAETIELFLEYVADRAHFPSAETFLSLVLSIFANATILPSFSSSKAEKSATKKRKRAESKEKEASVNPIEVRWRHTSRVTRTCSFIIYCSPLNFLNMF